MAYFNNGINGAFDHSSNTTTSGSSLFLYENLHPHDGVLWAISSAGAPDHHHAHWRRSPIPVLVPSSYHHHQTSNLLQPAGIFGVPMSYGRLYDRIDVSNRHHHHLQQQHHRPHQHRITPQMLSRALQDAGALILDGTPHQPSREAIINVNLKTLVFHQEDNVGGGEEGGDWCSVCLSGYENSETLGVLGCGHNFHAGCLKNWLLRKNSCPLCRAQAIGALGHY